MKIIIFGAPGSGKGTQAELISKYFAIKKISSGDILRSEINKKSEIGIKIKKIINMGILIPDEIILGLIKKNIENTEKYLLDGFPRTLKQAVFLSKKNIKIDYIINIIVPDDIIINRIKYRLIHPSSGRVYNKIYNPPKINNKDDITGEDLTTREDDNDKTIKLRLNNYKKYAYPILNWYKNTKEVKLINIDGNNKINNIFNDIKKNILHIEKNEKKI